MNKRRRYRFVLILGIVSVSFLGVFGARLQLQWRQEVLNRQLIAALRKRGATLQAIFLINQGADPNTSYKTASAPTFRDLWDNLIHPTVKPTDNAPTAFRMACGAIWNYDDTWKAGHRHEDSPQLVDAMIGHGAKINAQDKWGQTPLMQAVAADLPHTVAVLLEHGADPNMIAANGKTALQLAQQNYQFDLVGFLRKSGAKR